MSRASSKLLAGAAGAAGGGPVYVDDVFSTFVYQGTSSNQDIVNGLDLSGEGGLVWVKGRPNAGYSHNLYDTARGVTKRLASNSNAAESTYANSVTAFNSTGFSLGSDANGEANYSGSTYVSWSFRKQKKFFDIVKWQGTASGAGITVSHNLGSIPGMIIVKPVGQAGNWNVYHRSVGTSKEFYLNYSYAASTNAGFFPTAPDASNFYPGSSLNANAEYVAYLFAHNEQEFGEDSDEAITHCGTLTLTSGNVTNVNIGFEPQWLLIKKYSAGQSWQLFDNMRGLVSAYDGDSFSSVVLNPDTDAAESSLQAAPLANGFAIDANNWGTGDYAYVAIRRPNKPASEFAATKLFNVDAGANTTPGFDTGFPVDTGIFRSYGYTGDFDIMSRLTGLRRLDFPSGGTEANKGAGAQMDHMDGWSTSAGGKIGWAWQRAPGYFDVVCYTGSGGSTNTLNHNLGVVPEMMWVKRRDSSDSWWIYHKDMTGTPHNAYLILTTQAAVVTSNDSGFGNTAPTATQFTVGGFPAASSGTFIAYLFATVDGISKLGSYTGTGSNLNVDCGFSAGARFILIKRTDATGNWYLFDSVQGIVAGNDPYLVPNSTAAQVTGTDYIDPLSSGFTVTSAAPAGLNYNGGTYIFYAIA